MFQDPSRRSPAEEPDAGTDETGLDGSLRGQLLAGLAVLLLVALLAVVVAGLLWLPLGRPPVEVAGALVLLVVIDIGVLLLFGDYLLRRLVVRPVEAMAEGAKKIADGEYDRRLAPGGSSELRRLARSVNRMADRLIRNQRELEENVRSLDETNRALTRAKDELVRAEKLATVGRLAAGVAHEVGNPLNAIMGYVEIAERRGWADEEWVEGVAHEARRIDSIVQELLEYARPSAVQKRSLDANEIIDRALELLRGQGRFKDVALETELDPELPEVEGDPDRLQQVVVNLLLNATDAIEDGGGDGTVRISTDAFRHDEPIWPGGRRARRTDDPEGADYSHLRRISSLPRTVSPPVFEAGQLVVRIRVADDGVGLPEGDPMQVFDPFFTTKDPGRGTGLGLSVSARLVEGMGGRMVADHGEAGAVFSVLLPGVGEEESS